MDVGATIELVTPNVPPPVLVVPPNTLQQAVSVYVVLTRGGAARARGGLCDACAPTGALCASGAACCSGACNAFRCL